MSNKTDKSNFEALLQSLNDAGFQTNKGSNTYVLASVIHDYIQKTIKARSKDLGIIGLWETNDMNLLVPMMFDRYGIYCTRHTPKVYNLQDLDYDKEPEILQQLPGYSSACYLGDNKVVHGSVKTFIIKRLDNLEPTKLGVPYDALFEGSFAKVGSNDIKESEMSITGVYTENDYVILPNTEGEALFYPITNFKSKFPGNKEPITLNLIVNTNQKDSLDGVIYRVKDQVVITCDLLRFTLTQLMQSFPKYRGLTLEQFSDYIKLKYNADAYTLPESKQVIFVDCTSQVLEEIKEFADANNFKDYQLELPGNSTILIESKFKDEIISYLKEKVFISSVHVTEDLEEQVYHNVDMFYATKFGLEANYVKSQNGTKIKVDLSDSKITRIQFENPNDLEDYVSYDE